MLLFMVWNLSAAVADVTLPHEYMGRDPVESPTRWEVKIWLNVPGPFYTGWTDTCWTGRPLAPNNVLYSGVGFFPDFGTGHRNRGIAHITGVDAHLTEIDGHITLTINRVRAVHEPLLQHP